MRAQIIEASFSRFGGRSWRALSHRSRPGCDLRLIDLELRPLDEVGEVGLEEALRHNLNTYDAFYVALAQALDCELLTADRGIAAAPGLRIPVRLIGG